MELNGKRALIVEDDSMLATLMEDLLESLGCQVVAVGSRLADALEKAGSTTIDFATVDVNLAGELSYPVAALLRQRKIPFVFATGHMSMALPVEFKDIQVLAKPFSAARLETALRQCDG